MLRSSTFDSLLPFSLVGSALYFKWLLYVPLSVWWEETVIWCSGLINAEPSSRSRHRGWTEEMRERPAACDWCTVMSGLRTVLDAIQSHDGYSWWAHKYRLVHYCAAFRFTCHAPPVLGCITHCVTLSPLSRGVWHCITHYITHTQTSLWHSVTENMTCHDTGRQFHKITVCTVHCTATCVRSHPWCTPVHHWLGSQAAPGPGPRSPVSVG